MIFIKDNEKYIGVDYDGTTIKHQLDYGIYKVTPVKQGIIFTPQEVKQTKLFGKKYKLYQDILISKYNGGENLNVLLIGGKGLGKSALVGNVVSQIKNKHIFLVNERLQKVILENLVSNFNNCIIVIDEFEKLYKKDSELDYATDEQIENSQESLLNLFDGVSRYNASFILTANKQSNISEFLLSRPDRIKYILSFNDIDKDILKELLDYHKVPELYNEIKKYKLNYDLINFIINEYKKGLDLDTILKLQFIPLKEITIKKVLLNNKDITKDIVNLQRKVSLSIQMTYFYGKLYNTNNPSKFEIYIEFTKHLNELEQFTNNKSVYYHGDKLITIEYE